MSDLERALRALQERKEATGADAGFAEVGTWRLMALGLDLDIGELEAAAVDIAEQAMDDAGRWMVSYRHVAAMIAGIWADGVIAGALLQELRREAPSATED